MKLNKQIIITAIPIIGVNITAIIAQFQFIRSHLPTWGIPGQLLLAVSLESIAIQLSYFAHAALVSGDSATKLRLGAIGFATAIALANGSHYMSHGQITFAAVAVAICSVSSPLLWGTYSRRQSRDTLMSQNLIEGHAVRLGSVRWLFWPGKTFHAFRLAAWHGEQNPANAIAAYEADRETRAIETAKSETLADCESQSAAIRYAASQITASETDDEIAAIIAYLAEHKPELADSSWSFDRAYVRQTLARARARARHGRDTIASIESARARHTASTRGD